MLNLQDIFVKKIDSHELAEEVIDVGMKIYYSATILTSFFFIISMLISVFALNILVQFYLFVEIFIVIIVTVGELALLSLMSTYKSMLIAWIFLILDAISIVSSFFSLFTEVMNIGSLLFLLLWILLFATMLRIIQAFTFLKQRPHIEMPSEPIKQ